MALALVVSLVEMVGAVLVYALLALIVDPSGGIQLPLVGDLRRFLGGSSSSEATLAVLVVMAGFFAVRAVLRIGATYVQYRIAHNAGANLSERLVEGYLTWPYETHLHRSSAELIRNGHQAVKSMVLQVVTPVIKMSSESVIVLGLLVVLATISPTATALAILVVGAAALLLLFLVQPRLKQLGRVFHTEAQRTLRILQQSLSGIRDITVLGRERYFAREYGSSRRRMARSQYLRATAAQLPLIVIESALLGFILIYLALTLVRGEEAQESLALLGLFAYAGLRLVTPIQTIIGALNSLKYAAAPVADIHADLASIDRTSRKPHEAEPLSLNDSITVDEVYFQYQEAPVPALKGVSLSLRAGQQLGICGPTGGGKTTLVDVMIGLLEPASGSVKIDGTDLRGNERAWQRNIGFVPQMVFLIDDTLRRNIALGVPEAKIDHAAVDEAVRLAQLTEFIGSLPDGLDTVVGERGVRISGGQRQRIAIARALYRRPQVLVFDEGTSALDNTTEAGMMRAIEDLRGSHTVILIAHRLSTVRNADQIILLEDGRASDRGTYDELVGRSDSFRRLAGLT